MKKTKLNEANYYSQEMNKQYFSVSQYKDFCKCEAMAMAKINGTYEQAKSKALLLGSLVDELLTGDKESQDKFFIENKDELFKKNGEPYADVAQAFEKVVELLDSNEAYKDDAQTYTTALSVIGDYYAKEGNKEKALAAYTRYTKFNPNNEKVNNKIAALSK